MSEVPFDFTPGGEDAPSPEELAIWLSDFMSAQEDAGNIYRSHFCRLVTERIYMEFGPEGFCELMMHMDRKAGWISDIILENSDLDDILFKSHGVYDSSSIEKARNSEAMHELNKKIWRLRRKYAKEIVKELMGSAVQSGPSDSEPTE